jgi:aminoglycoside N3'-acetyltransferase
MPRSLKQTLAEHLPERVQTPLLRLRKPVRRVRYRLRERTRPVVVSRADLAEALRAVGVGTGDGLFVHSGLSRLGTIDGGAATVLAALEDVLGPDGLVAMPSFPYVGSTLEHLRSGAVFDVRTSPSCMGALTELLRAQPGAVRSLHPTHPVCARGPGAAELVADHDRAKTPFGPDSPFGRMVERGMRQVWLGVGITTFTIYHTFEALQGDAFPFPVLMAEPVETRCVDADGVERVVPTLVHDPIVSSRKDKSRTAMRARLVESGALRIAPVGRGTVMAGAMPELMAECGRLLREGITIYNLESAPEGAGRGETPALA